MELLEKLIDLKNYHESNGYETLKDGRKVPVQQKHVEYCEFLKELIKKQSLYGSIEYPIVKVLSDEAKNEIDLLLYKLKEINSLLKKINS